MRSFSAILNIRGHGEWKQRGLNPPDQVIRSTGQYRTQNDVIGQWIESVRGFNRCKGMKDLYASYHAWCHDRGLHVVSSSSLGKDLERRGFATVRARAGNGRRGIRLTQDLNGQSSPLFGQYAGQLPV